MILFLILNKLDFKQAAQNFQIPPEISVKFSFISPKKPSEIFLGGGDVNREGSNNNNNNNNKIFYILYYIRKTGFPPLRVFVLFLFFVNLCFVYWFIRYFVYLIVITLLRITFNKLHNSLKK